MHNMYNIYIFEIGLNNLKILPLGEKNIEDLSLGLISYFNIVINLKK